MFNKFTCIALVISLSICLDPLGSPISASKKRCDEALNHFIDQNAISFSYYYVTSCQTQLVAGLNYFMRLYTPNGYCELIIYKDLGDNYQLSNNSVSSCEDFFDIAANN